MPATKIRILTKFRIFRLPQEILTHFFVNQDFLTLQTFISQRKRSNQSFATRLFGNEWSGNTILQQLHGRKIPDVYNCAGRDDLLSHKNAKNNYRSNPTKVWCWYVVELLIRSAARNVHPLFETQHLEIMINLRATKKKNEYNTISTWLLCLRQVRHIIKLLTCESLFQVEVSHLWPAMFNRSC